MFYKLTNDCIRFKVDSVEMLGNPRTQSLFGLDDRGTQLADQLMQGCDVDLEAISESEYALMNALNRNRQFVCSDKVAPVRVAYLHVTSRCNMECPGCYSKTDYVQESDLSYSELIKIIDNLANAHIKALVISGGEPFLRKDIVELIRYMKQEVRIPSICCITNGTAECTTYIDACMYLDDLSFSLDGFSSESSCFRKATRAKVVNNIKQLHSLGKNVSIIFTLHKKNLHAVSEMKSLAESLGVKYNFSLFTVSHSRATAAFELTDGDMQALENALYKHDIAIDDTSITGEINCRDCCGAGSMELSVSANGDIFPCHMFHDKDYLMGNALSDDLNTVFLDKPLLDVSQKKECSGCEYRYICGGGCLFRSYTLRGNLKDTDPLCPVYASYIKKTLSALIG